MGALNPGLNPGSNWVQIVFFDKENEPESFEHWFDAGFKPGSNSFWDMTICLGAANPGSNMDQISFYHRDHVPGSFEVCWNQIWSLVSKLP